MAVGTVDPVSDDPPRWQPDLEVPETFTAQLVRELRARILDGRLRAGRLPTEPEMAGQFGVSRWTLREAIRRLSDEGLIKTVPRRGTFVVRPEDRPHP
jgi:DNA-binding GntR family transcriptional regulator